MTYTTANTQAVAQAAPANDYLGNTQLSKHDRQLGAAVISVQAVMTVEKNIEDFLSPWFTPYSLGEIERKSQTTPSANSKLLTSEQESFIRSLQDAWKEISKLKKTCGFEADTPTAKAVSDVLPTQRADKVAFLNDARDTIRERLIEILTLSGHILNDEQFDRAATPCFRQLGAPSPI